MKLKKLALPIADFDQAKALARAAADAVRTGQFGYALLRATKPEKTDHLASGKKTL